MITWHSYETTLCDADINECASSPCMNGGVCTDLSAAYHCVCQEGFDGTRCQTSKYLQHLIHVELYYHFVSIAFIFKKKVEAWWIILADIDECASHPCIYGTCLDGVAVFSCVCFDGYTGQVCETGAW